METKEWFETWFDSPYYHILYQHRDENEAETLIRNLLKYTELNKQSKVLDLACGKGRHAAFLSENSMQVTAVDLSPRSIREAKKRYAKLPIHFYVHDMRNPVRINYFDAAFNFFTSFGYFSKFSDNRKMLQSVHQSLKKDGLFLIDFMNTHKVIQNIIPQEEKEIEGVHFYIQRETTESHILKHIQFEDKGKAYKYTERVQKLMPHHFYSLFEQVNFKIKAEFGDYTLNSFNEKASDRYLVLVEKV